MIKFSIITVCLNAGSDLVDTIESTLNQSYGNFEIIVKDGFSVDGSIEKIPRDERVKLIQKKDAGIYDAMNQGIEAATGDYFIFMNAGDTFYKTTTLAELKENIEKKPGELYYGHCYNKRFQLIDTVPPKLTRYFCYRSMICHQATVYASEIIKKRSYDVSYKVSADRERMVYALIKEQARCVYVPITIAVFQSGGFCTTEKAKTELEEEDLRLKKQYFSAGERRKYELRRAITFPELRSKLVRCPFLYRTYKKIIGALYGTRIKEVKDEK